MLMLSIAPHAFYEMNDKLPEEAQIAVRENPSKEAHVVGLLSRDETLEEAATCFSNLSAGRRVAWCVSSGKRRVS